MLISIFGIQKIEKKEKIILITNTKLNLELNIKKRKLTDNFNVAKIQTLKLKRHTNHN